MKTNFTITLNNVKITEPRSGLEVMNIEGLQFAYNSEMDQSELRENYSCLLELMENIPDFIASMVQIENENK